MTWITTSEAAVMLSCCETWLYRSDNIVGSVIRRKRDGRYHLWSQEDCEKLLTVKRQCGGRLPDAVRVMRFGEDLTR